jgi:hypothetical protein
MANNNTPYFRIAVKFSRLSLSLALSLSVTPSLKHSYYLVPFYRKPFRGQPLFAGLRSPCRSDRSHLMRDEISFSRQFFIFGPLPFVFVFRIVEEMPWQR